MTTMMVTQCVSHGTNALDLSCSFIDIEYHDFHLLLRVGVLPKDDYEALK
jgi:hypothetical protein